MSLIQTRRAQVFPVLTPAQVDLARRFAPGGHLARAGERGHPLRHLRRTERRHAVRSGAAHRLHRFSGRARRSMAPIG